MCDLILRETAIAGLFQDQDKRFRFVGNTTPFSNPEHAERFGHHKKFCEVRDQIELSQLVFELKDEVSAYEALLNHPMLGGEKLAVR